MTIIMTTNKNTNTRQPLSPSFYNGSDELFFLIREINFSSSDIYNQTLALPGSGPYLVEVELGISDTDVSSNNIF